jgi:hypothetical protein
MKGIKRKRLNGALIPFTLGARKKYPFRTPVPPCSVVLVKKSHGALRRSRRIPIGYYSWQDGLDCIWLVTDKGKYETNDRSRNRPQFLPIA